MKRMHRPLLTVLATGIALVAHAHPGGLNKEGCHNNRKTGEYHCHHGASDTLVPLRPREDGPARLSPATPARENSTPGRPFRNCAEARAYGAAPVRRGDPGYGPHLDRDNDGVGCEPYRGR
ncbi:MAG TPA: excalibur calcium-binding domain-containing protein [Pseudoxanthomonas sp.]